MIFQLTRRCLLTIVGFSFLVAAIIVLCVSTATRSEIEKCFSTEVDTENSTLELVHIVSVMQLFQLEQFNQAVVSIFEKKTSCTSS